MEFDKNICPIKNISGLMESGKQFDLDITLPFDNREVIYGIVRDCFKEPICDAVVKLVEVVCEHGKEERRPVSHTFTDKDGEFVFGPLCPNKIYEVQIWVSTVKHVKICAKCEVDGKCLKGEEIDCPDHCHSKKESSKDDCKKDDDNHCRDNHKEEHKD